MLKEPHKGWEFWIFKRFKLINNAEILKYIADKLLSHFSRVWLCDPIDGSPPGSPVPGILQARTLEWVAISFSNAGKWKVKVKSLSRVRLLATPWTAAYQAPPSMGFSRLEYWSRVPLPSPPTCTGTQKSTCWELCFQATMLLLLLCLSKFFLNPSAHHPPPLSTLPWWDEYTALGFPGFLNKNYPTFCV